MGVPYNKTSPFCNREPVANAGPDQEVCEGDLVTLDGSASYDPDIFEPLTYDWTQIVGQPVTLSGPHSEFATFIAPAEAAGQTLSFQLLGFMLTVHDDIVARSDTVSINVTIRNKVPVADAGVDQTVTENVPVALSGSAIDPENTALSYEWTQVDGPTVALAGVYTANPTFTAPDIAGGAPGSATLVFQVTASDLVPADRCGGIASGTDTVVVTVDNRVRPPVADAGDDLVVYEDDVVGLDGSDSSDPDDDVLEFAWIQTAGTPVVLTGGDSDGPTFVAPPQTGGGSEVLTFELIVDDGFDGIASDVVQVTVKSLCTITGTDSDCDGVDNDCDGTADNHYLPVVTGCGVGACMASGATSCVAGAVVDSCVAGIPAASDAACDGADDNCDGTADDGYVGTATSCGVGACAAVGVTTCVDGVTGDSCTAGAAAASDSDCDAIDDDCNGFADDGFVGAVTSCGVGACVANGLTTCSAGVTGDTCVAGAAAASDSDCDGSDDDCNGFADDGYVGTPTSCGVGACVAGGVTTCVAGVTGDSCVAGAAAASDGDCDTIDDDCNGVADDDYVGTATSCGVGACAANGLTTCNAGVTGDTCVAGAAAASDSDCDAIDDDCNGFADDGYDGTPTTCGVGACVAAGVTTCSAGVTGDTCVAGAAASTDNDCDNIDDDCNGSADDDYVGVATSCGVGACAAAGVTTCSRRCHR